ncbi:MAG TPA: tetratricopeptide repeat protein [Anaeromyxobacter sp.]|nr:tetratricopeptide repeat protein [Anaeromyxobacter sp.]
MPPPSAPPSLLRRAVRAVERRPRLAIAVAAAVPYALTLGNPPVLDDGWAALDNPLVWSLRNVGRMFAELYGYAGNPSVRGPYRPITTLSYALNYAVHGRWTPGFHAVNVALHVLASVLLWALVRRLGRAALPGRGDRAALVAGLLFAVHPAHVEAVATIFGRTEPLAASFTLGALLVALRWRDAAWRLPAAVLLLTGGVLSKEFAILAPAIFLLLAWAAPGAAGLGARPGLGAPAGRRALLSAAAVAAALALAAIPYFAVKGLDVAVAPVARWFPVGTPGGHVALTMSRVLGEYLRILAFPSFLGGDFAYAARLPTLTAPTPGFWIATAAWAAALAGGLWLCASRRAPLEGAGVLWTIGTLTPVLHFVPVGVLLAERLLYLPSAGFCLAAGVGIARLLPATSTATATSMSGGGNPPSSPAPHPPDGAGRGEGAGPRARTAAVLAIAVLAVLAARTVARTLDWRSDVALWESELEKAPSEVVVNNNLAVAYTARGEYAKAARRLEVALAVHPRYWRAWVNLGIARRGLGDAAGARAAFERAVEIAPAETSPLLHLALFLEAQGDRARAAATLARARRMQPEDAHLARWHAQVLLRAQRTDEARAALEDAIRLDPKDAESRRLLAGLGR